MSNEKQRAEKLLQRINELAACSDREDCISRIYGTPAFIMGRKKVQQWMEEAGLKTWTDNIGNIRGRLLSDNPLAKTFVIASHIDTIINAGKFDGPLGVLLGIGLAENLVHSGTKLPFHLEITGFCDEEGCRFHTTYLGSKAITGLLEENLLLVKDDAGISIAEAMQLNGGDVNKLRKDAIAKEDWLGYFEVHIEQGPVLFDKNIPVAVVSAIAGQRRIEIIFSGEAGHAGTVPMDMRKDALTAAATFILEVEKFAGQNKEALVATVGKLNIPHAASNVIPGEVTISLDLRSAGETSLASAFEKIKAIAIEIGLQRGIGIKWKPVQEGKPVDCDPEMTELLIQSIKDAGYEAMQLVSGAGHDAVPVSSVAPVAMLFVKCYRGISHHPLENVELEDMAAAIKVSDNFIQRMIQIHMS